MCKARDFWGEFDIDKIPKDLHRVPTFDEMVAGYWTNLESWDQIDKYLPVIVEAVVGKGWTKQKWLLTQVFGLGAVFWDGSGGPGYFRNAAMAKSVPLFAEWNEGIVDAEHGLVVADVFPDPDISNTTKIKVCELTSIIT